MSDAGFAYKQTQQMRKITPESWYVSWMERSNMISNLKIERKLEN